MSSYLLKMCFPNVLTYKSDGNENNKVTSRIISFDFTSNLITDTKRRTEKTIHPKANSAQTPVKNTNFLFFLYLLNSIKYRDIKEKKRAITLIYEIQSRLVLSSLFIALTIIKMMSTIITIKFVTFFFIALFHKKVNVRKMI